MLTRKSLLAGASALAALSLVAPAFAQEPIKIGEINSYKVFAAFLDPYKKGMELAVDQVNAAGGVLGRKIEVVSRDDNGNPADAVRAAEELLSREKVAFLIGTFPSNVGLAVADFAKQKKTLFIAAEPLTDKIVWDQANPYTFRLRTSTYMQTAMLIPDAVKLHKKRWAIVYPNYEYGQSATAAFKKLLKEKQPDVEFVAEQATPLGKIDAGAVVQALADAKPDAIFSSLFGPDLAKFVRAGSERGLFKGVEVFDLLGGEPEYLDPLKDEAPDGWYVTGYPWNDIKTPEHKKFLDAYQAKFKDYPRLGSVVGYSTVMSAVAAIKKAGSLDQEKLVAAMAGLAVDTPFGPITYRPIDHQSTMGTFVGQLGVKDGKGYMKTWRFVDGKDALPSDDDVKKMRPAN
ncbi:amino acid/amide ABC transporter substrate-binding protein, HAAT family (TC 3.A.1.4.-) [Enhydrobacter aerosaccus]|uniref:Amino acid/amide ABC transporter substrate-binding protein, HAAT family (TC 3.A.1.4.-) n=1 Tax=Enhydrobacter aerosaccus TaxID=225324 RepID=A0A1T4R9X0_9HYPH|nr:ABC transporter substrate-binding protein [Enhydrobacter aerosaccus]SKA12824.1 amino acid/amide ABC transporter substrate-binding protein, HAAT family (TC 3.A.1.4.-) [Enhydrobacter aerosaccus]